MTKRWIIQSLVCSLFAVFTGFSRLSAQNEQPVEVHGPLTTNDVIEIQRLFRSEIGSEILPISSKPGFNEFRTSLKRSGATNVTGIYHVPKGDGCIQAGPIKDPCNLFGYCFVLEKKTNGWHIDWESAGFLWPYVARFGVLRNEADLILEAPSTDSFRLLDRSMNVLRDARGEDGYLSLIPKRKKAGGGLAVLVVPGEEIVQGKHKIMDEVILDVRDAAIARGFDRFLVGCYSHGFPVQMYYCLPTREEVTRKRKEFIDLAERPEKEAVNKPATAR